MNSAMSTQELVEYAVLDAHGLLDGEEQAAFEHALSSSSPQVQAMVRRQQTRLSNLDGLLPDVAPPAGMKAAVIGRIREEIARSVIEQQAPVRDGAPIELIPSKKVSPFWRAVAVSSLAASVALAVALTQLYSEFNAYRDTLDRNSMIEEIRQTFGSRFVEDTLFDPQTERAVFSAANDSGSVARTARASLWYNPEWDLVKLFCLNLEAESSHSGSNFYRLALLDEDGTVIKELHSFETTGGLDSQEVLLDITQVRGSEGSLAIIPGEIGSKESEPVLTFRGTL